MTHTLLHGDVPCYRRLINDFFAKPMIFSDSSPVSAQVATLGTLTPIVPVTRPVQFNIRLINLPSGLGRTRHTLTLASVTRMIAILYRWRIKPEKQQQFVESWSRVTAYLLQHHGSLGSRLHRGDDGWYYGYAQWESLEQRDKAFQNSAEIKDAVDSMRDAIETKLPETVLEPIAEFLTLCENKSIGQA